MRCYTLFEVKNFEVKTQTGTRAEFVIKCNNRDNEDEENYKTFDEAMHNINSNNAGFIIKYYGKNSVGVSYLYYSHYCNEINKINIALNEDINFEEFFHSEFFKKNYKDFVIDRECIHKNFPEYDCSL